MTIVALDIGGTNLRVAAVDGDGAISGRRAAPTESRRGTEHGVTVMIAMIEDVLAAVGGQAPRAIGVGVSGPVDPHTGILANPHTLPGWDGLDLRGSLGTRFGAPVVVDNDANAAAVGEWWLGAGRGARRLAAVTIGTGIGAAFLVDGEVQRAADGSHGEAGHQVIDPDGPACYCGARGCWEQLAAGPALPRLAADAGLEIADGSELTAAARAGDPRAVAAFARLGRWIGLGLVNITAIFCPDVVVIGGSVGAQHHLFGRQVAEVLAEHAAMIPTAGVRVCAAAYPDDAGLLGAAQAAMRAVEHDERGPHMSGLAQTAETDYAGLVKRLQLPPDFVPPAELAHEELVASALTRHDVSDDTAGINRSIELIQRTRGGPWPTGPVTDEYNFVDAVWHEQEFREGSSFTYVVREADGAYVGCAYLYPMGGRTKLTPALLHHDVDVSWWVTPEAYERGRYEMLHRALRSWVEERFPFRAPYFSNAVTP